MPFLDNAGLAYFWNQIMARLNLKVEKEELNNLEAELRQEIDEAITGGEVDLSAYETTTNAAAKLEEAKSYSDTNLATAKSYTDSVAEDKADSSHIHDDRYYTETEIDAALATKSDTTHKHDSDYDAKGAADTALATAKSYTDTKTADLASTTVVDNKINTHNTSTSAHNDIRVLISDLTTKLNNFLDVDDATSDQLSEVLTLIENNKGTLESLTTSKINVSDIIDNLTTASTSKVLSANQGVAIKALIDALQTEFDTHENNKSNPHGVTLAQLGVTATATELNYVDGVTSNVQTQLNSKMGDYSIELYNGTSGNPKPVKFATVNYSTCNSENGVAIKLGMVSGHGNGSSYAFLQDAIIKVGHTGNVTVDNFKYYGAETALDGARQFGDIFWTIDTTNTVVDFYCLMGQYARLQMTPYKRVTYSSGGTITQYTSCTVYSSGEKVWGNNSDIALMSDINALESRLAALEALVVTVHSGTEAPIASVGEDGDVYLLTR